MPYASIVMVKKIKKMVKEKDKTILVIGKRGTGMDLIKINGELR
jgi:transcriptional regulator with AAA-type ATPase domain